jgi:D-alanyl-D-alanine carboxypeptidase
MPRSFTVFFIFAGMFFLGLAGFFVLQHSNILSVSGIAQVLPTPLPQKVSPALDADFLGAKKQELIAAGNLFIEADLSGMTLRVWEGGQVVKEVAILTKGREGSWWETPAGIYTIQSKERNHFSSFGHVYQPYSMAFQGNFFIHGWPYYPNGKDVSSAYSGGCIRLSTADAKAVYDLVKNGTPVLVFEKSFTKDDYQYAAKPLNVMPNAASFLAADLGNNFVFADKNRAAQVPIASLTKLMTALVSAEYINLDHTLTVPASAVVATSKPRLKAGEKHSAYQLLYPLLEESSNEAALTLGDYLGRSRFVDLMNKKALSLGMTHTHFTDPAGMDEGNVSTTEDLFLLAKYLLNNRSFILKITSGTLGPNVYGPSEFKDLQNFNVFIGDPDFVGGKVGKTNAAKQTMMAIFKENFEGHVRPIVIIVLGSERDADDVRAIKSAILSAYGAVPAEATSTPAT